MVLIELETDTLAVLISGMYCVNHNVDAMAIPQSVWMEIAEKMEYFIGNELWDFKKISFEDYIKTGIFIFPTEALDKETLDEMMDGCLYWERENGNITLSISMDIKDINGV